MSVNIIVFLVFLAVLVFVAVLYRNSTLDKLPMLEGENILFDEYNVRVEQAGAPKSVIFINCVVRITDRRIIIAQKMLLSKSYALRHVIDYSGLSGTTDLESTLKKGYLQFSVSRKDVKLLSENGVSSVRIDIPFSILTGNQYIIYKTSMKERYSDLI